MRPYQISTVTSGHSSQAHFALSPQVTTNRLGERRQAKGVTSSHTSTGKGTKHRESQRSKKSTTSDRRDFTQIAKWQESTITSNGS